MIKIKNLYHSYEKKEILKDINLEIKKGETVVILGSSGAGKSTLLKCINNLIFPLPKGEILINNKDVIKMKGSELNSLHKDIGFIFQNFGLLNTMTVMDAVLIGRLGYNSSIKTFFNIFTEEDKRIALENIKRVALEDYTYKKIGKLSGGEKQRVGIARALSQEPKIMLADEPVSNLDPKLMIEIMDLIKGICKEDKLTLIVNLHFVELAKRYADRLIGLKDGVIVFNGTPKELTEKEIKRIYGKTKEGLFYDEKTGL